MEAHRECDIACEVTLHGSMNRQAGLAIGRTVSGLCPCPDPTDRSRYQNPSGPIRDLNGRVHARFSPKPTEYEVERSGTDPGFKSGTRRLPGYEIGNGTLRMVHISHFI